MAEFVNPIPQPVWASSDALEQTHLMWQVTEGLGVMVVDEDPAEEPVVIFLPFVESPERVFWAGMAERRAGLTLSALKDVVRRLEAELSASPLERPVPGST
jgi:hypothetical protein